jgi:hypothetical protein
LQVEGVEVEEAGEEGEEAEGLAKGVQANLVAMACVGLVE